MKIKLFILSAVLFIAGAAFASSGNTSSAALARKAVSEDAAESKAAIAELRSQGLSGLQAFLEAHAAELKNYQLAIVAGDAPAATAEWQQLSAALDQICQQRDCYSSQLYWHTDFEQAKAAAKASSKPILSLRLLGRLDEELSCANSRFFRLTLYANDEVSKALRQRYILHWESVRPVPKVTIDFGDGRKLERTLTGNSIHYVLDAEGRAVDALPGLYGPQAFLRALVRTEELAMRLIGARTEERASILREYHAARIREIEAQWASDIVKAKLAAPPSREIYNPDGASQPSAERAALTVVGKRMVERPVLRRISSDPRVLDPNAEDSAWKAIAALHYADARLDLGSRSLIRSKNPGLFAGSSDTATGAFERAVRRLEQAIAEDTVRNEQVMHRKLHQWFLNGVANGSLAALNDKVYAELFLTPSSDRWLGLLPQDIFSGIENDGIRK